MAYVDIHFISGAQGQIDSLLLVGLRAHNHTVLVLGRETELRTPLRYLEEDDGGKCFKCLYRMLRSSTSNIKQLNGFLSHQLSFLSHKWPFQIIAQQLFV